MLSQLIDVYINTEDIVDGLNTEFLQSMAVECRIMSYDNLKSCR